MITIQEITTKKQKKEFIRFPEKIYRPGYPKYIMPLDLHQSMMMGSLDDPNKYFLVARKDNEIIARAGFKVHSHKQHTYLNFGFFEAQAHSSEAVQLIFEAGHQRFPHLAMRGPFHFRMEDPYIGLLTSGFDQEPYFLMPYNPPYYLNYLSEVGFQTLMDLYTYDIPVRALPPPMVRAADRARKWGFEVRFMNPKKIKQEVYSIVRIFNDALSENWGFEEFVDDQVEDMLALFKHLIDPRVVIFVTKDGQDVACAIMVPNFNPLLRDCWGQLSHRLLWRYFSKRHKLSSFRGYALGVQRGFQNRGLGSLLITALEKRVSAELTYKQCEVSWVLSNNSPMIELAKAMDGKNNKTYKIFERPALNP